MTFLFRAAFWFAVVGAFLPRDIVLDEDRASAPVERTAAIDASSAMAELCRSKQAVCDAGEEIAGVAKLAGRYAAEKAVKALTETQ